MGIDCHEARDLACVYADRETGVAVIVTRLADQIDTKRARDSAYRACARYAAKVQEQAKGVEGVAEAERARVVSYLSKMGDDYSGDLGQVFKVAADMVKKGAHLSGKTDV